MRMRVLLMGPTSGACAPQATIGIDFLSKTMYLEDRTVRLQLWCVRGLGVQMRERGGQGRASRAAGEGLYGIWAACPQLCRLQQAWRQCWAQPAWLQGTDAGSTPVTNTHLLMPLPVWRTSRDTAGQMNN